MKTSLIIPSAGLGLRLKKFIYPKLLLPLYNKAIINHIIEFWNADEVIIVVRDNILNIVKQYTENKYIYVVENRKGSGYAVQSGLLRSKNNRVILNWCDVLPLEKPTTNKNIFFSSPNILCSFNGKNGGIYGVFLWNKNEITYPKVLPNLNREITLLDAINIKDFEEVVIPAIDIGDTKKYNKKLISCKNPIRSFNTITIKDNIVIKECKNIKLRNSEENWYKNMNGFCFIPNIISYNPLTMKKINGVKKFYKIKPLYYIANLIHIFKPSIPSSLEDCKYMYIDKTISRLNKISFLTNFGEKFIVNKTECLNPLINLNKINIEEMVPNRFVPIHGDLTSSNVLWENNIPYVIDPRGIFGNSLLYGDADYDIAKIYYSKTNWHLLNRGCLLPISSNGFEVENIKSYGRKIDFLLSIIWLSVTEYVKSNVLSVAYSYLLGSLLLQKWINKYGK